MYIVHVVVIHYEANLHSYAKLISDKINHNCILDS